MNRIILSQKSNKYRKDLKSLEKKDMESFAREQFRLLLERNLRIPVKLYHL